MHACGTCNMCCKLLDIPELPTSAGQWCEHCALGKGCQIYDARPAPCRDFECLWLESQREQQTLQNDLRHDRSRMMQTFAPNRRDVLGYADAPEAWKGPAMLRLLRVLSEQGHRVMFSAGRNHFAMDRDRVRPVELDAPDAQGERNCIRNLE